MSYFFLGADPFVCIITFLINFACLIISGGGVVLLWKRRHIFPLSGRHHALDIAFNVFCFLSRLVIMFRFILPQGRPCLLYNIDSLIDITGMAFVMVLRAWYLLFKGEIQRNLKTNPESKGWYLRNRHMITTKWLLKFSAAYYVVVIGVGILCMVSDNTTYVPNDPCPSGTLFAYVCSVWIIIDLIVVCFFAKKIHSVEHDSFAIQKELKRVGIFTVVALIFWQIETALLTPDATNYYVVSDFDNCFIVFVDLLWVTFLPLKATYNPLHAPNRKSLSSSKKPLSRGSARSYDSSSLEAVLANPVGYQDFFGFLAKEWSTENLLFWKQVNDYKEIVNQEERTKKAQAIYETFVRENAIYEVNLPDTIRSELRRTIEQNLGQSDVQFDLFDSAQNEIFSLMSNDSFTRFMKTEDSFVELSNINTVDVSTHDNSSAPNSRKDGSSAASTRVEVTIESKDSPAHTSIQGFPSDELEPLEKNVKEAESIPDENQHVFVL